MRRDAWALAAACFAVHCRKPPVTADAGSTASTAATVSLDASAGPQTDYPSLTRARADGDKALGKTVMVNVTRTRLFADHVVLHGCNTAKPLDVAVFTATYSIEQRPRVRAIPAILTDDCKRVVLRLGSRQDTGEILEVLDVAPVEPPPPHPGVDYTSIDDVLVAGKAAAGKTAHLTVRRQPEAGGSSLAKPPVFVAQPCDVWGTDVEVHFRANQSAVVQRIPTDSRGSCEPITVKLTKLNDPATGYYWQAELLGD